MQPIPRLLANLLVISVKTLANLLVKPTKLGLWGPSGPGPGEYTRERLVRLADSPPGGPRALGQPPKGEDMILL